MRKSFKTIIALILAILTVASFSACSLIEDAIGGGKVNGTYYLKTVNGKSVKDYIADYANFNNLTFDLALAALGVSEDKLGECMTFNFSSDGTGTLYSAFTGETVSFTWTQEDDVITLKATSGGETAEMTVKVVNKTLEFDNGLEVFTFAK